MRSALFLCLALLVAPTAGEAQQSQAGHCTSSSAPDSDRDGISDTCELELAERFAPLLVARSGGCNWDAAVARPRGGYFVAVQPVDSVLRVVYLPAYFRDCGWSGIKCWLPWVDCSPHDGDSELIVVELRARSDALEITGLFLSAHCFGRSSDSCRWYRGEDLKRFAWEGEAPIVWVAEGRNANYPTAAACDAGHHSIDTCDRHDARFRFPVAASRNIGSRAVPVSDDGCISARELGIVTAESDATECFWSDVPFRGWQNTGNGVTSYNRYLSEVVGF